MPRCLSVLPLAPLALGLFAPPAPAQQPPDAGRLLQQQRPAPQPPRAAPALNLPAPAAGAVAPGGPTVRLHALRFEGATVFTPEALAAVLGDLGDTPYDLAGLNGLARRITEHYRASGYPFARAFVPQQTLADGTLVLAIVEGRYGQVTARGDAALAEAAQAFLAPLQPGQVIAAASLARATLILDDLPGLRATPVVRPGSEPGTGDLVVEVEATPRLAGELGLDNHGNRYTGPVRARLNLQADSLLGLGDQATLAASRSNEAQWLGSLGYSLPLGGSGLRAQAGYAHTAYELAGDFAGLQASGTADTASLGLSYPVLRSPQRNLSLALGWQRKQLRDEQAAAGTAGDKSSHGLSTTLQFDQRDGWAGGGVSYGSVVLTLGRLELDAALAAADAGTARSQGRFRKLALDVARSQATPVDRLTLWARVSAQWASRNLDSSEDFGLGGPGGVRAYPVGEGFGDAGSLLQAEARWQAGAFAPYAFWDAGRVKVNRKPWDDATPTRHLAGGGLGLRVADGAWTLDASVAWRTRGGPPQSDPRERHPRLWANAGWRF